MYSKVLSGPPAPSPALNDRSDTDEPGDQRREQPSNCQVCILSAYRSVSVVSSKLDETQAFWIILVRKRRAYTAL